MLLITKYSVVIILGFLSSVEVSKTSIVATSSSSDVGGEDEALKRIEEDCLNTLKEAIIDAFPEYKSAFAALPIQCFR